MSSDDIIAIIKWGPVIFFLLMFLIGMICGAIKGRRKTVRRLIYVIIYTVLIFIFTPKITELVFTLQINGNSVEGYINNFINENEKMKEIMEAIPGLKALINTYPQALVSLLLFVVLMLVGLPLSFPIYFIYMAIYALISRFIFKYSRYKRDENFKIVRNEKGKKIKLKRNKHRFTASLIKGTQTVLVASVIFVPVGVITRLYKDANDVSSKGVSNIEYFKDYKQYLEYLDAFNNSFIGKATNSGINEKVAGHLSKVEVDESKSTLEKELSGLVVAGIYIEESGIIQLLSNGDLDLDTLDLSTIKMDKLDAAIEAIFNIKTLNKIIADGVNYVLESSLEDTLIKYTDDNEIISKIKYKDATEVKNELLLVTGILKDIINIRLLNVYRDSKDNYLNIVHEISYDDVEKILNKVLSIKILSNSMPGIVGKLLKDYGLTTKLTTEHNREFVDILLSLVKLVKVIDLQDTKDLTDGNIVDNLTDLLYKDGAIENDSIDSLATFLSKISSSGVFDSVLVTQLNKLLEKQEITLNAQMIVNVKTSEDWKNELKVLDNVFELFVSYRDEEKIDFAVANELLANIKNTKAMILVFPIAYKQFFPQIGIEVDPSKIVYVDYDASDADEQERQFYTYWKEQVEHFENISKDMNDLNISAIDEISLNLLEDKKNIKPLSRVIGEVFSTDLIKDGVRDLINDTMQDLLTSYEIELNASAIDDVNDTIDEIPYYIVVDTEELDVVLREDKYYINDTQVQITGNTVMYNGDTYLIHDNTLARIWESDLNNLSDIVVVLKDGEYTDKDNLETILNSVDNMRLLKNCKTDLLLHAVKEIDVLPSEEYDNIDKSKVSFTKEKNILLNIVDKHELLSDISNIEFSTIEDSKIADLAVVLENALDSDIFGNYVANTIVDIANEAEIPLTNELVRESSSWEDDLKLMKKALNMNIDEFNADSIGEILDGIEASTLLSPIKEDVLLQTARKIEIDGITIDDNLTADEIIFADEKNAILTVAENLELVKTISSMDLQEVSTEAISDVLTATLKSKIFSDSVVNNLVSVFTSNDIKHDLDTTDSNDNLKASIRGVSDWNNEFETIKSLLDINAKENVGEAIFTKIESSELLGGCRANILLKVVTSINDEELVTVSISELTGNDYELYTKEKELLIAFASAPEIVDIGSVETDNKSVIANILNKMKESEIFSVKYKKLLKDITAPIQDNQTITEWGLQADEHAVIEDWNDELDCLLSINETVESLTTMTSENINTDLIGKSLDAIDNSKILSGSQDIANNLVKKLSLGYVQEVKKDDGVTWQQAFDDALKSVIKK